jgi:Relaxase/Mobilisation nuclease domain
MIVRILSNGSSFKGCAAYLTHDPRAETNERVGWTHTLNLANDHVPSAVDEMVWTARNAELLKQEAGIRAGGRATENSVKHLSLNWSPEDNPTREHMIETTEEFLRHMKWQEHQAIIVAHDDKEYKHVHCMINMVHPETGLRLDDNFERRRAQTWALQYEQEQGRVYCSSG